MTPAELIPAAPVDVEPGQVQARRQGRAVGAGVVQRLGEHGDEPAEGVGRRRAHGLDAAVTGSVSA